MKFVQYWSCPSTMQAWHGEGQQQVEGDAEAKVEGPPQWVGGLASSWDTFVLTGTPQMGIVQQLAEGCIDEVLERNPSISFLAEHQGLPLASTRAKTLEVWSSDRGIEFKAQRNLDCQTSADVFRAVGDGRYAECSFGFQFGEVERDVFRPPAERQDLAEWEGAPLLRHTRLQDVFDVSVVSRGRNPVTEIGAWQLAVEEGLWSRDEVEERLGQSLDLPAGELPAVEEGLDLSPVLPPPRRLLLPV